MYRVRPHRSRAPRAFRCPAAPPPTAAPPCGAAGRFPGRSPVQVRWRARRSPPFRRTTAASERDTGAFSSATGTPTWTDHPSVPARTRWTVSTSIPSRVWVSQRIRAAARNGFLHGGRFRTCTDGLRVGRARDDLLLGVNDGAGPSGGQPGLTKNGADLVGQQPDGQDVAKFTVANNRHTQRHQPLADRRPGTDPSPPSTGFRVRRTALKLSVSVTGPSGAPSGRNTFRTCCRSGLVRNAFSHKGRAATIRVASR